MSAPQVRPVNDHLLNLGIGALAGGFALAMILRGAGTIVAWATGLPNPTGGFGAGI